MFTTFPKILDYILQTVSRNKTTLFECLKLYTLIVSRAHGIVPADDMTIAFSRIPIELTSNKLWLLALTSTPLTEFAKVNWMGHLILNSPQQFIEVIITSVVSALKIVSPNDSTTRSLLTKVICPAIQKISTKTTYKPASCNELFEYASQHHLSMIQTMSRNLMSRDIVSIKNLYKFVLRGSMDNHHFTLHLHLDLWSIFVEMYSDFSEETKSLAWMLFMDIYALEYFPTEDLMEYQIQVIENLRISINQMRSIYARLCSRVIKDSIFSDISPYLLPFLATDDLVIKSHAQDIIMMGTKEHM